MTRDDRRREWVTPFDHVHGLEDHVADIAKDAVDDGLGKDAIEQALRDAADEIGEYETRVEPRRSEPADFGGGDSTGVQDL